MTVKDALDTIVMNWVVIKDYNYSIVNGEVYGWEYVYDSEECDIKPFEYLDREIETIEPQEDGIVIELSNIKKK